MMTHSPLTKQELIMKKLHLIILLPCILFLAACDMGGQSKGFTLPEGDAESGKIVFQSWQCTDCHTVKGVEFALDEIEPIMTLQLGGSMRKVYTYGELTTSIINPSHKISTRFPSDKLIENGASKMPNYNQLLTVAEVIDLVAFLEQHYELKPYTATRYNRF